jgi:voltage-gated potassium channel
VSWKVWTMTGGYSPFRRRVWELFAPQEGGLAGKLTDSFILLLIAANVVAVMLETIEPIHLRFGEWFHWFEVASVAVFSVEYLARLWTAVEEPGYERPIVGRLRYAKQFLMLVDLLAILPFYLAALGIGLDFRFLRALRLVRLFRLFKAVRYSQAVESFLTVLRDRREKLVIAVSANLMLLIVASSAMYLAEHPEQPDAFPSIPETLWWGIVTLTTVGYGDIVPLSSMGRMVGGVIALLGIGMFAIPAALIATGFSQAAGLEDTPKALKSRRAPMIHVTPIMRSRSRRRR